MMGSAVWLGLSGNTFQATGNKVLNVKPPHEYPGAKQLTRLVLGDNEVPDTGEAVAMRYGRTLVVHYPVKNATLFLVPGNNH